MADKNFLTDIIDADLAEGKIREIHTRFPPEPNGYLHIGSAKAIYINWSIANQYGGKFNLRLDDTNPAREGEEYVNSIIEDLHWLGADPNGGIFYGSDYFDQCYEYAEKLIKEGKAYVDDLSREEMREYRGADAGKPSRPSPYRDRTPEENLDLFRRMRAGEFKEGEKTLRAKIDLATRPSTASSTPSIIGRATSGASTRCTTLPTPSRTPSRASPTACAAWSSRTTARCTTGSLRTSLAPPSPSSASLPA
jgi:glutaminyl-tRNA synthetase